MDGTKWYADGRIVCVGGKQDCAEVGLDGRAEKICEWHNSEVSALQYALAAEQKRREEAEERLNGSVLEYVDLVGRLNEAERRVQDYSAKFRTEKADHARLREALVKLRDMQIVETLPIIEAALAKPEVGA